VSGAGALKTRVSQGVAPAAATALAPAAAVAIGGASVGLALPPAGAALAAAVPPGVASTTSQAMKSGLPGASRAVCR
jgi:hypothetical protein